jgi:hypothetical protein
VADLGPLGDLDWFRSLDWGYINFGCVLWWACLPDSVYYIRSELKYSHLSIGALCRGIRERDRDLGITRSSIRYTVADPSIWGTHGDDGERMDETFAAHGVILSKGVNDRKSGWVRVREVLNFREDGRPTIIMHPHCKYLIRSLSEAVSSPRDPEDIDTNSDDHALDTLRYGAMSRPAPTRRSRSVSSKTFVGHMRQIEERRRRMSVR